MATEVTLSRFDLSDVDAMMAWASDPEVATFCSWEPYSSTEPLLAYIRDTVLPHPWFRAICLPGDGRPVGEIFVTPTDHACRVELGYVLARAHWGRGVATAAVTRALAAVFGEVEGLARVEALVDVDNAASQRVAEKAGFRREGVLRRHYWHKGRARDLVIYGFVPSGDPLPRSHEARRPMEQEAAARAPERADNKVALRPFHLAYADADAMAAWASDPVLVPPTAPMAFRAYSCPCPSFDALLALLTATPHPWFRAVSLDGAVVGVVSVTVTDDRCRAEIWIALARAHCDNGVAASALRLAARAALGDMEGVERVEALVDADEDAARRALDDAGFRLEAVLRSHRAVDGRLTDVAVYSLIPTDDAAIH